MKPVVIYPKNNGDNITITKKEFEEYLRQAYDAGHADGYSTGRSTWLTPITYPTNNPLITWTTTPNDVPNPYKITCEAYNDLGG